MRVTNLSAIKKTDFEIKNTKIKEIINLGQSIKRAKTVIKSPKNVVDMKDGEITHQETIKKQETKIRQRNYFQILKMLKTNLEDKNSHSYSHEDTINLIRKRHKFIDDYQSCKIEYLIEYLKNRSPLKQVLGNHQITNIKVDNLNLKNKTYIKQTKTKRPNSPYTVINKVSPIVSTVNKNSSSIRKKYNMIKSTSSIDIKTSSIILYNYKIENKIIIKRRNNNSISNWSLLENRFKINSKKEFIIRNNTNIEDQMSKEFPIYLINNVESQSRKSTMDSEYDIKEYQENNKVDSNVFLAKKENSTIINDNELSKKNKEEKYREYESQRKIRHKKSKSFKISKPRIEKYKSFSSFYSKKNFAKIRKSKSINKYNISNNISFLYDNNNHNKQSLLNDYQKEIYNEIINNKKIYYLTKHITDFYNKYITICKNGILRDKNKYPLLKSPKISVIIPLYNATKFLNYSLRSVQNQKMKEIEIILIDDCSTDDTLLLVKKFMEEDPRIKLIKNNVNRKILYSKSIGALNANGKYILQLDQDDLFIRDDLFDILFNEAENNNLDLVQIKDITSDNLYIADKTRVNCHRRYQIHLENSFETMPTHYETSEQLKNKLFIDGYVFTLWGLLIKSDVYKKAIYYFWPVILNYKFTYYEDYIMTTIIIFFSKNFKFLNNFGLLHIKHKSSAMSVYSKYLLSYLLLFENVLYKYYIKNNPEDIKIILNILKKYNHAFKDYYNEYPKLFQESIIPILSNEYLTEKDAKSIREELEIKIEDFNFLNSYQYLMNSDEFLEIKNFQKPIINNDLIISNVNEIKISIIIYCIQFKYLKNTINTILNQKFKHFEIIIIYDNNESSNLKLIKDYIKYYKNIHLINNQKKKGILFSYSSGILASNGEYILILKQGETLAKNNILNNLYNEAKKTNFDILECNLLINNCDIIKSNSLSLYRCTHFESVMNYEFINYDKNYLNLDKENDILTNKLIKSDFYKNIINKYKIIDIQDIIYNYYNEIFLFLFSKEGNIFKRINEYGIIHYNNIDKTIFYDITNNNHQKIDDTIFYINFLFENTSNSIDDKKIAVNEYFYLFSIIYNKFNKMNNKSIKLIEKFITSEFITNVDKNYLQLYYDSCIN